jgi:polysaccharide biosynthesis PFTS motif protein
MTWSKYLVWDDYQAAFIRRAVGDAADVSVVGPIPFYSGVPVQSDLPVRNIGVFDVQPMRNAVYQPLGLEIEYYVPRNANKFLTDIQESTAMADRVMVLKRKRDVGSRLHPSYERTTNWLSATSNYLEIDPGTSASALIERCQAVISMPFTSTALIGRGLGKPSVYYDPHGVCEKDDRAAHGIPILSGKDELKEWLSSLPS